MDIPRLRILMLGSPIVTWDGVLLKISRQQIRLLLFYLAAQTQPVNRDTLCQIFWPTEGDEKAHKLLREALSKLRASLPDPSVLIAHSGEIYLDPQKVYMDAVEFKQLTDPFLESADVNRDAQLPEWLYSQLKRAYDLCRGPIKVAGANVPISIGYENFLSMASQQYDYIRLRVEERLASHCIALGNLDEAILWLGRTVEIDPLNNENNFLILNCLKDSGRNKDALDYITYLDNLYRQSSGHPLPEPFFAIQQRINEMPAQFEHEPPEWPGIQESPVPFVGRIDLLAKLRNAYNRKGIVSVRGPSGIGKNRLVQEFYLNLQRKPRLVFCTGKPMARCYPFEPLIEGLRVAVKPEEWLALPDEYKESLKSLFPELRHGITEVNTNSQAEGVEDFLRICEGFHQLFILLSQKRPLLMIMDIVVWTDEATIELLSYLSDRDFYKKYGLLVLFSRKEESSQAFEVFVDRNVVLGRLEKIDILPLTLDESVIFVQKMLGSKSSPQFVKKFYQQTGGNPYFMVEGLKALVSTNFNFQDFSSSSLYPIPDTIKALINEKIMSLSEAATKVLRAGAVLGQYFQAEVVEAIEEMSASEMVDALEDLERHSVISIRKGSDGTTGYFFDHDQIREVVLSEMSPLRKRHLNLAAVNALIKVFGHKPELESTYACHFEEAGEPVKAFDSWILAADFGRTRFSKSDRYYAYEQAYNLIGRLPQEFLIKKVDELVYAWGDYAYDLSDIDTSIKIYTRCLEVGEQTQDPALLCEGWNGRARVCEMQHLVDDGIEAAKRAQFYSGRIDNLGLKLHTIERFTILYSQKNEVQKSIDFAESVLEYLPLLKNQREMDAMVNILVQLGLMYMISGWPLKTIELGEKALNLSLLVKRRSAKVQAAAMLAAGQYYLGDYQKSLQNALAVHSLAERLNFRWWLSFLDVLLGRDYLGLGNMDLSWSFCHSAMKREQAFENGGIYPLTFFLTGEIYRLYGDIKCALNMYQKGMSLQPTSYQTLENAVLFGITLGRTDPEKGIAILNDLIEQGESIGLAMITLPAKLGKCQVAVSHGNPKCLESQMDEIIKEMNNRGFGTSAFVGELIKARVETAAGNKEGARQHYQKLADPGEYVSNVWVRLNGITGLLSLAASETETKKLKSELNRILAQIGEKSTQQPLKRLFYSFRKKLLENQ